MKPRTWILIRGLCRESAHWGDFPVSISTMFPNDVVHTLDLPGFGNLHGETVPLSIEANVKSLQKQLSSKEIKGSLNLLAISLGGMVALKWLELEPEKFSKAFLVNTSFKGVSSVFKRLKLGAAWTLIRTSLVTPAERERRILKLTSHAHYENPEIQKNWGQFAADRPLKISSCFRQLWAAIRVTVPEKISTPVELLVSEKDKLCDASCSLNLARHFGNWSVHLHPTAGHDLTLDDPEWVIEKMR